MSMNLRSLQLVLFLGWLPLSSVACSKSSGDQPATATASLSGYNHTSEHIGQYYVNGQWGGNIYAYEGGGSFVCCIVYPRKWHDGLVAKVRWTTSSSNPADPRVLTWHEKIVPIERYETTGTTLNVHFLPDSQIRLVISSMTAGTPGYPGPDAPVPPPDWPPWKHVDQAQDESSEMENFTPPAQANPD